MTCHLIRRACLVLVLVMPWASPPAVRARGARSPLPPDLAREVAAHEERARAAKQSPDELCRLVAETPTLHRRIRAGVPEKRWEDVRATGIYFVTGPEFSRTGIDYGELSKLADQQDAPLLRALALLEGTWKGISNVPAWAQALTDMGGCHAPALARPALTNLAESWPRARPCLRNAVRAGLEESLQDMARDSNFCHEDRAKRLAAAHANAALMRKLDGTRGPVLADELERTAKASTNTAPRVPG